MLRLLTCVCVLIEVCPNEPNLSGVYTFTASVAFTLPVQEALHDHAMCIPLSLCVGEGGGKG